LQAATEIQFRDVKEAGRGLYSFTPVSRIATGGGSLPKKSPLAAVIRQSPEASPSSSGRSKSDECCVNNNRRPPVQGKIHEPWRPALFGFERIRGASSPGARREPVLKGSTHPRPLAPALLGKRSDARLMLRGARDDRS
jgi:hypothetical protein